MRAQALVGADAQPFHHAGPEALDQRVGTLDEIEQRADAVGVLEVDGDVAPAAQHEVGTGVAGDGPTRDLCPLDADHVGAEIGQQHRRERAGPDAGELDDAVARERAGAHWCTMIPRRHSMEAAGMMHP